MILHEFLIGFKITICKSNQNLAGCCSGDPVLVFNHRFRIEYNSKLVVKVEFSVLIYENEKCSMASSLKDASPSIPSCVSWAQLRFNLLQYLQDMEMLARSVQLWSCFLVTTEGMSVKSHLSVPLLTLFLHIHSADICFYPWLLIKQLELEINADMKTHKSSFKSTLLRANPFFFNEGTPAYRSDKCGNVTRHKYVFNCKYVLKFPSTLRLKVCVHLSWGFYCRF